MANSQIHDQGWISVKIDPKYEEIAKKIRADRDAQYGNIFAESSTDERWVGDLGELAFKSWLKHEGIGDVQWVLDDAAGNPDFVTRQGVRIGVKTVKRQGKPKDHYTAQITARHAKEPIDFYFFMTYEIPMRRMWLLGGINRAQFLREARFYAASEWVHKDYQIRPNHEIYNIEIAKLARPKEWIVNIM